MALCPPSPAATTLATVGDSFADGIYFSLLAQPKLLAKYDIRPVRWSRPSIGLTRSDLFDYVAWLRDAPDLGQADYCAVQIGANDMQPIPTATGNRAAVETPEWR